jgi:hypothetical protein
MATSDDPCLRLARVARVRTCTPSRTNMLCMPRKPNKPPLGPVIIVHTCMPTRAFCRSITWPVGSRRAGPSIACASDAIPGLAEPWLWIAVVARLCILWACTRLLPKVCTRGRNGGPNCSGPLAGPVQAAGGDKSMQCAPTFLNYRRQMPSGHL